jgi:hypothetical protein
LEAIEKMKRMSLMESWCLRSFEMLGELRVQITLVFFAAIAILALAYALGYVPDPWLRHGQGAGWECDATRPGARTCAKDVPEKLQKPH